MYNPTIMNMKFLVITGMTLVGFVLSLALTFIIDNTFLRLPITILLIVLIVSSTRKILKYLSLNQGTRHEEVSDYFGYESCQSYKKEDDTSSHLVTSSYVTDLTVVTVRSISLKIHESSHNLKKREGAESCSSSLTPSSVSHLP